jgi:hypothetical protein
MSAGRASQYVSVTPGRAPGRVGETWRPGFEGVATAPFGGRDPEDGCDPPPPEVRSGSEPGPEPESDPGSPGNDGGDRPAGGGGRLGGGGKRFGGGGSRLGGGGSGAGGSGGAGGSAGGLIGSGAGGSAGGLIGSGAGGSAGGLIGKGAGGSCGNCAPAEGAKRPQIPSDATAAIARTLIVRLERTGASPVSPETRAGAGLESE